MTINRSLLRPFDLDAAKAGAVICTKYECDGIGTFVGMADNNARFIIRWDNCQSYSTFDVSELGSDEYTLRMAPLLWVEGKPVYKGDALYRPQLTKHPMIVDEVCKSRISKNDQDLYVYFEGGQGCEYADNRRGYLTWKKPTIKRSGWVNIYATCQSDTNRYSGKIYDSEADADYHANSERIACVFVEWEE